jgi:hypothetical protein
MRCEKCHGKGYFEEYYICSDCNGSGITSCCDTAGSNVGEVSMKKIGEHVSEHVRETGSYISEEDRYIFAHNTDSYLIWNRKTGQIVWVGEEGKLGEDGYSIAWDKALELNETNGPPEMTYSIVACVRVANIEPDAPSKISTCAKCKKSVYVALSTPTPDNAIYMCLECIDWKQVSFVHEPTEEQLQDIAEIIINKKLGD